MWRPEGWKTEEVKENPLHCLAPQVCADHFFEAGADAMLEALRKRYNPSLITPLPPYPIVFKGSKLVLIPDDEEK